ncbi:hypothetical protein [Salinigranum rubrum]
MSEWISQRINGDVPIVAVTAAAALVDHFGLIAVNPVPYMDLYGHANSTH